MRSACRISLHLKPALVSRRLCVTALPPRHPSFPCLPLPRPPLILAPPPHPLLCPSGMGGGSRMRNRPVAGDDQRYDLRLDFTEAVFGCQKEIEVSRLEECKTCSGSGVKAGSTPTTCDTCKGQGQVTQVTRTPLGMFQQVGICPTCGGSGEQSTPCGTCQGDGRVR